MSMKIGGAYKFREINADRWKKFALEVGINSTKILSRAQQMATALPDISYAMDKEISSQGITNPIINQLAEAIAKRSIECRKLF